MDGQDWEIVQIKKRGTKANANTNTNKIQITPAAAAARKIEQADVGKPRALSVEMRTEITQRRVALGKNQVQLNQDCRFPVNTIRDIESGRYCPNPSQLSLLNRILHASIKYSV
jgi:ribosome-binding protein aMBF1 (putative translation factor)